MHTYFLSLIALIAFAANSVLCRLALSGPDIDPASFTSIRLLSGALMLCVLVLIGQGWQGLKRVCTKHTVSVSVLPSLALFAYAAAFSLAYVSLDTGTGALLLFSSVQFAMLAIGYARGARYSSTEYLGVMIAFAGFIYLIFPGASAPPILGSLLMIVSGIAWAGYSLAGQRSGNPVMASALNFTLTLPFAVMFLVLYQSFYLPIEISSTGVWLAIASGALASGAGYAVWYAAVKQLSVSEASIFQLAVPLIAAFGGVVFVGEVLSTRLQIASALILGGIFLVVYAVQKQRHNSQKIS